VLLASWLVVAILGWVTPAEGRDAVRAPRRVRIVDYVFSPRVITITRGTRIVWRNADRVPHTTTAMGGAWNSGSLAPGASFGRTFRRAGTFRYICAIHPHMRGTVRVTT